MVSKLQDAYSKSPLVRRLIYSLLERQGEPIEGNQQAINSSIKQAIAKMPDDAIIFSLIAMQQSSDLTKADAEEIERLLHIATG